VAGVGGAYRAVAWAALSACGGHFPAVEPFGFPLGFGGQLGAEAAERSVKGGSAGWGAAGCHGGVLLDGRVWG